MLPPTSEVVRETTLNEPRPTGGVLTTRGSEKDGTGRYREASKSNVGRASGIRSSPYEQGGRGTNPRDPPEQRGCRITESFKGKTMDVSNSNTVSTKQGRIAELARQAPGMALTSLSRHMDLGWLREAFRRTRKDGAKGIDGQSATDYAVNLEANLQSLLDRAKSGDAYKAPPCGGPIFPRATGKPFVRSASPPSRTSCSKGRWSC